MSTVDRLPATRTIKVADVQHDWRVLDQTDFSLSRGIRLISHESFISCPEIDVEHVRPGPLARFFSFSNHLFQFAYALQLLLNAGRNTVLILNGAGKLWIFAGLLNRLPLIGGRCILCWDIFVEVESRWKKILMKAAMAGFPLSVLWSRDQIAPHARFLGMPEARFIFLPFKANHSQHRRYDLPIDNFIFSGGNGKRDYPCLIEAVRDTGIPVIISATAPEVLNSIELLPNTIVLGAPEPAFGQLQAAARFVVIPMTFTGLKGGGEANFCNAMWHGRPIIAADSISASEYIVDGETGFVVPSGDSQSLRKRILELWHDPEKAARMGEAARRHVEENFTHEKFIRRLLRLALVLGREKFN